MGFTVLDSISVGFKDNRTGLYVNICKGLTLLLKSAVVAKEATEFEPAVEACDESLVLRYVVQVFDTKGGKFLASVNKECVLENGVISLPALYADVKADFTTTEDC